MVMHRPPEALHIGERLSVQYATDVDSGLVLPRPELSSTIEILQRQSDWIGQLVAACTQRICVVSVQSLPGCEEFAVGILEDFEIHIRRWIRDSLAKKL